MSRDLKTPERWDWRHPRGLHWMLDTFLMRATRDGMPMTNAWGINLAEMHTFLANVEKELSDENVVCRYICFLEALTAKGVEVSPQTQAHIRHDRQQRGSLR